MLQAVYQRFAGSCMMLMRRGEEEALFCGTAFLVHDGGYLLSTSACADGEDDLVAVPYHPSNDFTDLTHEEVSPIPVKALRTDLARGIALLQFVPEMDIAVPDHILGNADRSEAGASVMGLGFSFGHHRLHNLVALHSTLSSKIETPSGNRLILFDAIVHDGDSGGPLVDAHDARIIGIILGTFDPVDVWRDEHPQSVSVSPSLSYACSIEYGVALLEAEGVDVV
jgi:serine protease Do